VRRKTRGTLQINEDVKRLFMLAKPLHVTSSEFLKGLLASHTREVRETQQRAQRYAGLAALNALGKIEDIQDTRSNCAGRPQGAKDIAPRTRRTKEALARAKKQADKTPG
jgi:hypothetical protein